MLRLPRNDVAGKARHDELDSGGQDDIKGGQTPLSTTFRGPTAGKMMAELIQACENGHDHDTNPVEFMLEHLKIPVSMGFASRNREINQNSSFSVIG